MATLSFHRVCKRFGDVVVASDISLAVGDGELVVLLGPSGCGKSTLLRLIAGLETPDAGTVHVGGRDVTHVDPSMRDIAFVFQSYALYPHKTVRENITFPLRMRAPWYARTRLLGRLSPAGRRLEHDLARRASAVAAPLGLDALLDRKPAQLSGGQRQRVALARALVRQPAAFLLDEPLSNLDVQLRAAMRAELRALHQRIGATFVYVTHDQGEALSLADRVVLLRDGGIEQIGPPHTLYDNPVTSFVATFVGSPAINMLPLAVDEYGDATLAAVSIHPPRCIDGVVLRPGLTATVACRPHGVAAASASEATCYGRLCFIEPHGDAAFVTLVIGPAGTLEARLTMRVAVETTRRWAVGDRVPLRIDWARALLFDATGRRMRQAQGTS